MRRDFLVERVAQPDNVSSVFIMLGFRLSAPIEPKAHRIHEVETRRIHDNVLSQVRLGAEENRRTEDTLESASKSAVLGAILSEPEIIKQLSRALEVNDPILLLLSERGDPNRDQAILA